VLYQDAVADPVDAETAEPEDDLELNLRRWQHHAPHSQCRIGLAEVDATLARSTDPGRSLKLASALPLVHHRRHHYVAHSSRRTKQYPQLRRPGEAAKRLFDIVGALTLSLLFSPLLLVVGLLLVRDRSPIIYSHTRTGRHGKAFGCLKFRTMVPDAERVLRDLLDQDPQLHQEWLRDQKLRNDPRVTAIGRFLRRTSLDELPQLWNVLKGDMSLVGPRPVMREEWQRYGSRLNTFLAAKPGVTGLWQVMGRSDTHYRRRVALDSFYVRKRSLLLDAYILLMTVKVVLGGRGAC
jgi:lipopolysaccharide/colanic/teichoic acid biosynthesis glycosyltransferase